jgi:hypothetical protein
LGAALQADGETRSRFRGLKHLKEKRSMDHFAGLSVRLLAMSACDPYATLMYLVVGLERPIKDNRPHAN